MKIKGKEGADWGKENGNEIAKDDLWFKKVSLGCVPFIPRPKGGNRIDFYAYANLQDMAREIQERKHHKYKHTGDVHRNAHYIGMYLLREMELDGIYDDRLDLIMFKEMKEEAHDRQLEIIRERVLALYDKLTKGMLTEKRFSKRIKCLMEVVENEEDLTWLKGYVDDLINSNYELNKSINRQRMREARSKLKLVNINEQVEM